MMAEMNVRKVLLGGLLVMAVGLALAAAVRSNTGSSQTDKVDVVTSFYPLYDFARQVGGDKVVVQNLTPAGAEPHDYEPAPAAMANAQDADMFIYNGNAMESWAEKFLADYNGISVVAAKNIDAHHEEGTPQEAATGSHDHDPHFWLDPVLAQEVVTAIRDGFIKADPANTSYYTNNAAAYNRQLAALDQAYRQTLSACQLDTVVASHAAFGYVAERYGFTVEATAGINSEDEPSPARLAEISGIIRQKGLKYIFFERLVSPRLAATIAQETGAQTLVFDPLEGLTDESQNQGHNYLSIQRENVKALGTALACS